MKKIIALVVSVLLMATVFCSCRTVNDTKPKNETTNPNPIAKVVK